MTTASSLDLLFGTTPDPFVDFLFGTTAAFPVFEFYVPPVFEDLDDLLKDDKKMKKKEKKQRKKEKKFEEFVENENFFDEDLINLFATTNAPTTESLRTESFKMPALTTEDSLSMLELPGKTPTKTSTNTLNKNSKFKD